MEMISESHQGKRKYNVEMAKSANEKHAPSSSPVFCNLCSLIIIVLLFGSTSVYLFIRTYHLHNDLQHITHNLRNPTCQGHENLNDQLLSFEKALRNSDATINQLTVHSLELQQEIDTLKTEKKLYQVRNTTEQENPSIMVESKSELRELHQLHQNLRNDLLNATHNLQNLIHEVRENVKDQSLSFEKKLQNLNATINRVSDYSNQLNIKVDRSLQHEMSNLKAETTLLQEVTTMTSRGNYLRNTDTTMPRGNHLPDTAATMPKGNYLRNSVGTTSESTDIDLSDEASRESDQSFPDYIDSPLQKVILPTKQNSSSGAIAELHPKKQYKFCGTWYCLENSNRGVNAVDFNKGTVAFTGLSYCITYGSFHEIPEICPPANERKLLLFQPQTKQIETPEKKCLNQLNLVINKENGGFVGHACDSETIQEFTAVPLS